MLYVMKLSGDTEFMVFMSVLFGLVSSTLDLILDI